MQAVTYSWIVPIKNEALSLPLLFSEIKAVMEKSRFEIIAIDDASTDNTLYVLKNQAKKLPELHIVPFSTHQGKWAALTAGFKRAKGGILITVDSDLQDDPAQIPKLLVAARKGYDVVSGWRKVRYDPLYKIFLSRLGNRLVSLAIGYNFADLNAPFKLYRREVLSSLPKQGSLIRFSLLFAKKLGYRTIEIPIVHRPRRFGKSKFGIVKYGRIFFDLILVLLLFSGSGRLSKQK